MQYIIYLISVLNPENIIMADEDTFQVACPRCGDTFNVPILLLEKKAQCPGCGAKFAMEPPPGPAGRELKARAMRAKEEAASGETTSVHIPLKGAKPVSRPSTNTVKLARFKSGAEENNEKLAAVQNQQAASGVHVDQSAIQKELAQNSASSGRRRTISSGVNAAPAPAKKWWEFWKK